MWVRNNAENRLQLLKEQQRWTYEHSTVSQLKAILQARGDTITGKFTPSTTCTPSHLKADLYAGKKATLVQRAIDTIDNTLEPEVSHAQIHKLGFSHTHTQHARHTLGFTHRVCTCVRVPVCRGQPTSAQWFWDWSSPHSH